MKRNILPFGIIAIVGIFVAVIVFYVGVNQKADLASDGNGEGNTEEVQTDPEAIYANSCASCHANDLTGGMGPDLTEIGASLSADDIESVILNGQGAMPAGAAQGEEAKIVAEWLAEKK